MIRYVANSVLVVAAAAQISLAVLLRDVQPSRDIVPPVPTARMLAASALGDNQLLYRLHAMGLQNFGDTGGRWTSLSDYDLERIVQWFKILDRLDLNANHHVTLAARYFSQTQDKPALIHLVRYLQSHVRQNPENKLQWLSEALHMARVRLQSETLVLEIADQLGGYDFPKMSPMAYQLPAALYESAGHYKIAAMYMERALRLLEGRISDKELQNMLLYLGELRAYESASDGERNPK